MRTALREMAKAGVKVSLVNDTDAALVVRISGAQVVRTDGVMRLSMREVAPVAKPEPAATPAG